MGDVNVGSAEMRNFKLGTPALVCRWRLASGRLPLENRHLRALSRRVLDDEPVSPQLIAWAKQHVEWTLREGSAENPNGVLMLIVDEEGQAAMTVGPYEPLAAMTASGLVDRATAAQQEADETSVAPETLLGRPRWLPGCGRCPRPEPLWRIFAGRGPGQDRRPAALSPGRPA